MAGKAGTDRPGNDGMKDFRGPEPKMGEADDPAPGAPVEDNPGPQAGSDAPGSDRQPGQQSDDNGAGDQPQAPKQSPADEARNKIFKRFQEHRDDPPPPEPGDEPADGDTPDIGENAETDPNKKAPAAGPSDSGDGDGKDKPKPLTLSVNGKTITKSLAEVASLAELSEDEVAENPARAIKYAQRELATQERLNEAKRVSRSATPAPAGSDRQNPNDPHQGRDGSAGNDKDHGQPDPSQDTTDDEFVKLAEALQIDDPKVAGKQLAEMIDRVAESKAGKVRQDISAQETSRLIGADKAQIATATKGFIDEHPELAGNKSFQSAMRAHLIDEYRADLKAALIAEGDSEEEAEQVISQVSEAQIATAHQQRRLKRDPHVRPITKDLMESAFEKVSKDLGVSSDRRQPPQSLGSQREQRKQNLQPQPRRASVPPATPPAPKAPITRSQAVADMKRLRGQGRSVPASR